MFTAYCLHSSPPIILEKLGLVKEKIYFLAKPQYFRTIYITMGAWTGVGFSSI